MLPRVPGAREVVISNSLSKQLQMGRALGWGGGGEGRGLGGQITHSPLWSDPLSMGKFQILMPLAGVG